MRPIPSPDVPVVDSNGRITQHWYEFFQSWQRTKLTNLADVFAASPSDGDVLVWDATSQSWVPAPN